jgi:UDP-2,3-diacylglucosamine hydrolase
VKIGLIAGSGSFPLLFARAAREQGLSVHAVAHRGEADPSLEREVESLTWVKLGQVKRILSALKGAGVERAVMAGGIGRARSLKHVWPDAGAWKIALGAKSLRDDELLRAIAAWFENGGVQIVAPTDYVKQVLAPRGLIAGRPLREQEEKDVALGREVCASLGRADVGQTVVVKQGAVLAVEAIEGTDEAIRRGGALGGRGAVVVKRVKPGQDARFDLPAAGPVTLEVMREAGARVLAVEAHRTVLLDGDELVRLAPKLGISVLGFE